MGWDLRVEREQRRNPAKCFSLVNTPPDEPGHQVVDHERHQERCCPNWMRGVVQSFCLWWAVFNALSFAISPQYESGNDCVRIVGKGHQFSLLITIRMGFSADVKLCDANQISWNVHSWQCNIEKENQDGLLHLLECWQHFPSSESWAKN